MPRRWPSWHADPVDSVSRLTISADRAKWPIQQRLIGCTVVVAQHQKGARPSECVSSLKQVHHCKTVF